MNTNNYFLRNAVVILSVLCLMMTLAAPIHAAEFGPRYDSEAAVSYAAAHWDDGVGVCDEFVKACLKAGGVEILAGGVDPLKDALLDAKLGSSCMLSISSDGVHSLKSENANIHAGDILFFYCEECKRSVHTAIIGGYDEQDRLYLYAHNPGWDQVNWVGNFAHSLDDGQKHRDCYQYIVVTMDPSNYSHAHNFTTGLYETEHPHKMYAKCSCDAQYYLGWNARVSSCTSCNPPISDVPIVTAAANEGAITVSWTTVQNALEYQVWRSRSETGTYFKIYSAIGTRMTNTSVTVGETYYYKVIAVLEKDGEGNPINTVSSEVVSCSLDNEQPEEKFQVVFQNWDGTVISEQTCEYGDTVTVPADPTRTSDNPAAYTWEFTGWDKPITPCQSNATYTAQYRQEMVEYTVTFKNWDGSVISKNTYNYGDAIAVPADPTRPDDGSYTYTFAGWDKAVAATCSGNATYTATYTATRPEALNGAVRVFGATRYDTAFGAADMLKELQGVEKFQTIVVACGTDFADALSGSYLANQKNAPILLVRNRNQEIDLVKAYIRQNLAPGGTVYLLGGTVAIPASMETGLEGFTVKRLAGATRYETNLAILKEAGVGDKDILVCTGKNFADGLSASAVNMPILLVKDSLNSSQKAFLDTLGGDNKIYIIGGTNAVNKNTANALATYGTVERIEGATRYETSVNIAKKFFPDADCVVLAYGNNFPDGLSGGPLACALDAPLILTTGGKEAVAVTYAAEAGVDSGVVLGGTGLISDKVVRKICQLDNNAEIPVK
jgi:putative cell wall-binding protein